MKSISECWLQYHVLVGGVPRRLQWSLCWSVGIVTRRVSRPDVRTESLQRPSVYPPVCSIETSRAGPFLSLL